MFFENRRDVGLEYAGIRFSAPEHEIVCYDGKTLHQCLSELDALRRRGYYLAGFLSYEAGYVLRGLGALLKPTTFPLLHFFAFKTPDYLRASEMDSALGSANYHVHGLALDWTEAAYEDAFRQVKAHLTVGDTYQVNLTSKYQFEIEGSHRGLYTTLRKRQKVAYSALFEMPAYTILSLSPELFFRKAQKKIQVKPMKGTMPRCADKEQDKANQMFLTTDEKSRAENLIIVDLLRNDLATISKPGSLYVPELLAVESYETVHQMTSSIESEVSQDLSIVEIMSALFPCGSITGAPKRRTMEIIHALEHTPRYIYTGAMGYITPDNDMCFNVSIRTLLCRGETGELGVGGGIVYDSDVQSEFEEMQLKAQFFSQLFL